MEDAVLEIESVKTERGGGVKHLLFIPNIPKFQW
jgi:hypothetical protein